MSFGSFTSFRSVGNSSLAWSMGSGGKGRLILEFPFPLDKGWYQEQPCKEFRTFEHRKERKGFQHEFIVLRLKDGSVCRVERMGDPAARFDALSQQGSAAYDMIQTFRPEEMDQACLSTSDVVVQVTLPCIFDLLDVLKICRAIHEGAKTRNYTLRLYNCYFFSLAVQACLTRLVAHWESSLQGASLRLWLEQIRDRIKTIADANPSPVPVLEQVYSILISPEDRLRCKKLFASKLELEFRSQTVHIYQQDIIRKELESRINDLLWYSCVDLDLDQFIEEMIRVAYANVIRSCTGESRFGWGQAFITKRLKLQLLGPLIEWLTQEKLTTVTRAPRIPDPVLHKQKVIKQKPVSRRLIPVVPPATRISELSYICPQEQVISIALVDWYRWVAKLAPYSFMWLLHLILSIWGITLFTLGTDAIPCISVEEKLDTVLAQLENWELITSSDQEICMDEMHALTRSKYAIWTDNPWTSEQPLLQTINVSEFQLHLLSRIRAYTNDVERAWMGSAHLMKIELENTLSQVWKLIREDHGMVEKTKQSLVDSGLTKNTQEMGLNMTRVRRDVETIQPKLAPATASGRQWRLEDGPPAPHPTDGYNFDSWLASRNPSSAGYARRN
ncbi:unnamed protein product [Rhizoctonia solani]|uniref:Uncharacterized protein n=1 Tax=Rhizoctonia solani TaxID=456999 RepID=A0A8H3AVT6_9AGAM|nr:unnamed protein product [Rhizoctonia solani]